MARLVWDQTAERLYETGVRYCVAYPFNRSREHPYSPGVAWNGLTAVKQNPNAKFNPVYADDIRYLNLPKESLSLTIDAYTYPDVIAIADGSADLSRGIKPSQQRRKIFGLSYMSRLGNDVEFEDYSYKLHLIYGCMAAPIQKPFATINQSIGPITFTWDVVTNPVTLEGFRPVPLITIDASRTAATEEGRRALQTIQDILWGTDKTEPYLPLPWEVMEIFAASSENYVYRLSSWEAVLTELYARDSELRMSVPAMTGSTEFQRWIAANNIAGAADFEAGKHAGAMDKIFSRVRNTAGISAEDLPVSRVLRNGSGTETFDTDPGSPETLTAKVQVRSGVLTIAWTVAGIPAGTARYTANLTDESPPRLSMYISEKTAYYGTWLIRMGTPQWDTAPAICSLRPWIRVAGSGLEAMDVAPGGSCKFTSTPILDRPTFHFEVCTHSTGDSVTFARNGTYTMTIPYSVELISVMQVQEYEMPSASLLTKLADQTGLFLLAEPGLEEFTSRDSVKTWPITLADAEQGQALDVFGGGVMAMSSPATRMEPDLYAYSLLLSGNVEPREIDNDGQPMTIKSVQAVYGTISATYPSHDQVQFYAFDVERGDKGTPGGNSISKDFDVYRKVVEAKPNPVLGTLLAVVLGENDLTQTVYFIQSSARAVTIDWGDGSPTETSEDLTVTLSHTYAATGPYVISLVTEEGESWRKPYTGATSGTSMLGGNVSNHDTVLRRVIYDGAGNPEGNQTVLPFGAFCYCDNLRSFKASGATKVPDQTCREAAGLQDIILDGVTYIGAGAFANCTGLTELRIPQSVTDIGVSAFSGCTGLQTVTWPDDGVDRSRRLSGRIFSGCTSLLKFAIPDGWTYVPQSMFLGCTKLKWVTLPSSLLQILYQAFENTSALTEIEIPASVNTIEGRAFYGSGLTHVEVSAEHVGALAFGACPDLTAIWIRSSVLEICSPTAGILSEASMVFCKNGEQPNEHLVIYCEADSKPAEWNYYWNYLTNTTRATVVWRQKTRPW